MAKPAAAEIREPGHSLERKRAGRHPAQGAESCRKPSRKKLIAAHRVEGEMTAGDEIGLKMDQTLTQDATGTMVMLELEAIELDRVQNLGLRVVIAKSFARIHWQNLVSFGILPLVFDDKHAYQQCQVGDVLRLANLPDPIRRGARVVVTNAAHGGEFITSPFRAALRSLTACSSGRS